MIDANINAWLILYISNIWNSKSQQTSWKYGSSWVIVLSPSCICNALHKTLRIFGLRFPVKRRKQHVCATNKVANNASIKERSEQAFIFRSKLHVASVERVWRFDFAKSDTNLAIHHPRVHGPKLKTSKCWHQVAGKSCGWLRMSRQRPHIDRTWRTRESPPKAHNMDTIASIKHRFLIKC